MLNADPLPWLLDPVNPSVRFWTLVDLLDEPLDSPRVQEAQAAAVQQPLVQELFARQHPEGHWGDDASKPYTAEGAIGVLSLLYLLGVPPDERTAAGCRSMLENCQHESGGFSLIKKQRSGIFPCTTGEHLPFLDYFGLAADARVRAAFTFLCADGSTGLECGRYAHRDCLWGAISALNGLAVLPATLRSEQSERKVACLAGRLLDAALDFDGEHRRWLTFGVPRAWDLLSAAKALATHGYGRDERFQALFRRVLACQDELGRWRCGSVSRTWPLEKRGQPSRWVTLDVLRVIKKIETR